MTYLTNNFVNEKLHGDLNKFLQGAAPHTRIASARTLAREYGISKSSVVNLLNQLEQAGQIYKLHGKGSFVADHRPPVNMKKTIVFVYAYPTISHNHFLQMIHGAAQTVSDAGLNFQLCPIGRSTNIPQPEGIGFPDDVIEGTSDGVILPWIDDSIFSKFRKHNPKKPILVLSHADDFDVSSVLQDHFMLGKQSARILLPKNCRNIAAICRRSDFVNGISDELAVAKEATRVTPIYFDRPHSPQKIASSIAEAEADALAFGEDRVALDTLNLLKDLCGEILQSGKVTSHSNKHDPILPEEVNRLEFDGFEFGRIAAETLINLIEGKITSNVTIKLKANPVATI